MASFPTTSGAAMIERAPYSAAIGYRAGSSRFFKTGFALLKSFNGNRALACGQPGATKAVRHHPVGVGANQFVSGYPLPDVDAIHLKEFPGFPQNRRIKAGGEVPSAAAAENLSSNCWKASSKRGPLPDARVVSPADMVRLSPSTRSKIYK